MFHVRLSLAFVCILIAGICVLIAKPNTGPKPASAKCKQAYYNCLSNCPLGGSFAANKCHRDCNIGLTDCCKKAGIETPQVTNLPPQVTASAAPRPSPTPKPKGSVQPQGNTTATNSTTTIQRTGKKKKN